jgi:hypothetical protein
MCLLRSVVRLCLPVTFLWHFLFRLHFLVLFISLFGLVFLLELSLQFLCLLIFQSAILSLCSFNLLLLVFHKNYWLQLYYLLSLSLVPKQILFIVNYIFCSSIKCLFISVSIHLSLRIFLVPIFIALVLRKPQFTSWLCFI